MSNKISVSLGRNEAMRMQCANAPFGLRQWLKRRRCGIEYRCVQGGELESRQSSVQSPKELSAEEYRAENVESRGNETASGSGAGGGEKVRGGGVGKLDMAGVKQLGRFVVSILYLSESAGKQAGDFRRVRSTTWCANVTGRFRCGDERVFGAAVNVFGAAMKIPIKLSMLLLLNHAIRVSRSLYS